MIKCDRCGAHGTQLTIKSEHTVPLAVVERGYGRSVQERTKRPIVALVDEGEMPIPGVPTLCDRCFKEEMKRARDNNTKMTMGEFLDLLRRGTVH